MTVLLDRCGCLLPSGRPCDGVVMVTSESGGLIEGECASCHAAFGVSRLKADPTALQSRRLEQAGLPARFASRRFVENAGNRLALEQVRGWFSSLDSGTIPAPALWGDAGRGKSHFLTSICRKLIVEFSLSVAFYPARQLLRELQQFSDETARRQVWDRAVGVDVLALDDLGAQAQTGWKLDVLADLLDERYHRERAVVLATNFPPVAWGELFDARSFSRLRGMVFPVELKGEDQRVQNQRSDK